MHMQNIAHAHTHTHAPSFDLAAIIILWPHDRPPIQGLPEWMAHPALLMRCVHYVRRE